MKSINTIILVALIVSCCAVGHGAITSDGYERTLFSPNGRVACRVTVTAAGPQADVSFDGKPVFVQDLGFVREKAASVDFRETAVTNAWKPVWGFRDVYPDRYRELTISLRGSRAANETVSVRCYDEGFAVRASYPISAYSTRVAARERTSWRFVDGACGWPISWAEETCPAEPLALAVLDATKTWCQPLTLVTLQGVWASVLEAQTPVQPRCKLRAGKGVLRPEPMCGEMEVRTRAETPWRVVQLASSAGGLVETAYLVENLNPPCAIRDTSWIAPGLTVSDHGNCGLRNDEVLAAARKAKALGARYFQLDWGWYGTEYPWSDADRAHFRKTHAEWAKDPHWEANTRADPFTPAKGLVPYVPHGDSKPRRGVDLDIPLLVRELKALGMGLCLYVHGQLLEETDLEELFACYESWGVAGLKPGFVAFGSQRASELLVRLARTAARHRLWLDIHDAPIPDGFQRTWPNVMLTEGVGGEEGMHPVYHNVVLPFTRGLAGPMDFTPRLYLNHRGKAGASKAHKLALFLAYAGPTAVMRGRPAEVADETPEAAAFLHALPWNYDETRVLAAEPGKRFVVARRKGDDWFVAGLAGREGWTFETTCDFLPKDAARNVMILEDAPEAELARPRGYRVRRETVRAGAPLGIRLAPEGGFVLWTRNEGRDICKTCRRGVPTASE